jgi:hypothetical protein
MTKILSLVCAILCLGTTNGFAKIWRVNNNVGVNADFTDGQAAVDAASNGDSIYFEPSRHLYAGITISNKTLNVFTGSTSGYNFLFDTLFNRYATVDYVNLYNADKSYVSVRFESNCAIHSSDSVTFDRCAYTNNAPIGTIDGLVISDFSKHLKIMRCRLSYVGIGGTNPADSSSVDLRNCMLDFCIYFNSVSSSGIISHNTFFRNSDFTGTVNIYNATVINNIFIQRTQTVFHNSFIYNNIECNVASYAPNKLSDIDSMDNVFVGSNQTVNALTLYNLFSWPLPGFTEDNQYLTINSGYASYGAGAINTNKYNKWVPTPLPAITSFILPNGVNTSSTMQVSFSATSNK